MGKGRALKTGINYILNNYSSDEIVGVITGDSDGQHCVEDTIKIAKKLYEQHRFVLGCRDFTEKYVPPNSRFSNKFTMLLLGFLYGKKIGDTQTGLRGFLYDILPDCLSYTGERYEYEMHMLIEMVISRKDIVEVPIKTIYYDGNKETHFSAVKDSIRIYRVLLGRGAKYIFSSLCGFWVDISLFALITNLLLPRMIPSTAIFVGTTIARSFSCIANYLINKNMAFRSNDKLMKSGLKYVGLVIVQLLTSWCLVTYLYNHIGWNTTALKIIVDTCLFFVSYKIQHKWVFKS